MPKEIYPSSYECDCGHLSEFSEGTIWEMEKMSRRKRVQLGDHSNHTIIFYEGEAIEIICSNDKKTYAFNQ